MPNFTGQGMKGKVHCRAQICAGGPKAGPRLLMTGKAHCKPLKFAGGSVTGSQCSKAQSCAGGHLEGSAARLQGPDC